MPMRVADAILNGAGDFAVDAVDDGTAELNGVVEVYAGSPPGSLGGAPAGDLLAVIPLEDPAFGNTGASVAGEAEANGVPITTAGLADGTVGFIRVLDRDETVLWDDDDVGTVGTRVIFNTLDVATGIDVTLLSYTFTVTPST